MELTRVIHPIGQDGLFPETSTDNMGNEIFNADYDCGSETEDNSIEKAIITATKAHSGQVDKAGATYIMHPES